MLLVQIVGGLYRNENRKGYYPSIRNLSTNLLRKKYTKLAGFFDAAVSNAAARTNQSNITNHMD